MKYLGKIILISILFLTVLTTVSFGSYAADDYVLNIHLFHSKTCPHCKEELAFFEKLLPNYPNVKLKEYEITSSKQNVKTIIEVGKALKADASGVPFLVIGQDYIVGFQNADTTGVEIENTIKKALIDKPEDLVQKVIDTKIIKNESKQTTSSASGVINVPFIGKLEIAKLSLPILTAIVGTLDGFNPCAMWVLLFLISILIGLQDRKKMWILGGAFLLTSGVIYYLFMAAWLNVFLIIGYATIVRYIIATAAIGIGIYYLRRYIKNKDGGCETADYSKKQKIFERIKNITAQNNLVLSVIGICSLAVAVNMLELLCSAGLPAIYTKVLAMTPMSKLSYYLYLLGYVFFFMLDDLIVFIVAMLTFKTLGIESKYSRYSQLIGGIIMLLLGIIMIINPALLTFGVK